MHRRTKAILISTLALIAAGALLRWNLSPIAPSVLITNERLPDSIRSDILPQNYRILTQKMSWKSNAEAGRYEREYQCTVVTMDNSPVDRTLVCLALDAWFKNLVFLKSAAVEGSDDGIKRVFGYESGGMRGEFRYALKPIPGATYTEGGKSVPANFQSLEINISEERKP